MNTVATDYDKFSKICMSAVRCNRCFDEGLVQRPFIDIAQPRYVGSNYWNASKRLLFLMINPGSGHESDADKKFRAILHQYRSAELDLDRVFEVQREQMPSWGRNGSFMKYFDNFKINFDDVALINVAWCAAKGKETNEYPKKILDNCFAAHTRDAIKALKPTDFYACGSIAQIYARSEGYDRLAGFKYHEIHHYAARNHDGKPSSNNTHIIRLLRPDHIKSGKSAFRFACYSNGMTVTAFKERVRRG